MKTVIVSNPAIEYFLAKFRDETTGTYECNMCVETISIFLAGEVSKYLSTNDMNVKTPLGHKMCPLICEDVILVPVLRAGLSMLSGFQRILPNSKTAFIWAHRDKGAVAQIDKYKFPSDMKNRTTVILDTMLATGGTVNLVSELLLPYNPKQILCASILAIPNGVERLSDCISAVFSSGFTDKLDDNLYVFPGVGDSGDRLYG